MATTDRMALKYFVEDSFGVAPSPPDQKTLLITSEDLTTNFETIESESVDGDRQVRDLIRTGKIAEGSINFELVDGNIDDWIQGALADAWTSNVAENGSSLFSYGLEKHFQDLGIYYRFAGVRVDGMSLDMSLQSIITGSLSVMGKGGAFSESALGGSVTAAPTNPPMVTLSALSITEGATAAECPTAFTFQTTNELRQKRCLGDDDISGINLGIFRVTGTLEAYFESRRYVDKIVADTATEFEVVTQDSEGNSYTWTFPAVKFTTLDGPGNTGRSQDVMTTLGWTAYKDPSTGITMQVSR